MFSLYYIYPTAPSHSKPKSSELAPKGTTFGQSFRAALGERPFFGGEKPGPVDLSLFGAPHAASAVLGRGYTLTAKGEQFCFERSEHKRPR